MKKIIVIMLMLCNILSAADCVWVGGTGNWSDTAQWVGGGKPDDPNDCAYFPAGNYTVFITEDVDINFIRSVDQNVFMATSFVRLQSLFQTSESHYLQQGGGLFVEHIVGGYVAVHSGVFSLANINMAIVNILPTVAVQNFYNIVGDLNGDGTVDLLDLSILAQNWLQNE